MDLTLKVIGVSNIVKIFEMVQVRQICFYILYFWKSGADGYKHWCYVPIRLNILVFVFSMQQATQGFALPEVNILVMMFSSEELIL